MDKLWVFGDSFTAGHGCTPEWEYYKKFYKEGDGLWSQHLANELNLKLVNLSDELKYTLINSFTNSIVKQENYFIYFVEKVK